MCVRVPACMSLMCVSAGLSEWLRPKSATCGPNREARRVEQGVCMMRQTKKKEGRAGASCCKADRTAPSRAIYGPSCGGRAREAAGGAPARSSRALPARGEGPTDLGHYAAAGAHRRPQPLLGCEVVGAPAGPRAAAGGAAGDRRGRGRRRQVRERDVDAAGAGAQQHVVGLVMGRAARSKANGGSRHWEGLRTESGRRGNVISRLCFPVRAVKLQPVLAAGPSDGARSGVAPDLRSLRISDHRTTPP
jgi:hypothetical protein